MRLSVSAVDYHTAGEPFRIVTGGVPVLRGQRILDKRRDAAERLDHVRRLLVYEPRGHADMYGCFVTEPEDDGGDLGVVFFHNAGYSTACGHGTIALVTWALDSGLLEAVAPVTRVVVDAPSGRLETRARLEGGRVASVSFTNVPSFVEAEGLAVATSAGEVPADISFGGAFYASVDAAALGIPVRPQELGRFIALGREIKAGLEDQRATVHPLEPELRDIYGVIFYEALDGGRHQRNVTIFADGEVDRSPCGSGTSARLALLHAQGALAPGDELVHESIIGTRFSARISGQTEVAGRRAVLTEVAGSAYLSGYHHFVLDDTDPLGTGFLLR